jgi:hypothetical protein
MMVTQEKLTQRELIHKAIDELSLDSLDALGEFVAFLRYKEEHDMDWFYELHALFAPVRAAAAEMSDEEIDEAIDDAIEKVRREKKTQSSL